MEAVADPVRSLVQTYESDWRSPPRTDIGGSVTSQRLSFARTVSPSEANGQGYWHVVILYRQVALPTIERRAVRMFFWSCTTGWGGLWQACLDPDGWLNARRVSKLILDPSQG